MSVLLRSSSFCLNQKNLPETLGPGQVSAFTQLGRQALLVATDDFAADVGHAAIAADRSRGIGSRGRRHGGSIFSRGGGARGDGTTVRTTVRTTVTGITTAVAAGLPAALVAAEDVQQATMVALLAAATFLTARIAASVATASRFAGSGTITVGRSRTGGLATVGTTAAATVVAAALAASLVAAEQAVVQTAKQTAAAFVAAALLLAARITGGRTARRGFTAIRGSTAGRFRRTAGRFATLIAATSGFARLATAVAAAVVQA